MSRTLIMTGLLAVASLFVLAAAETGGRHMAPGAWAGEYQGKVRSHRHTRRGREPREAAASPEEIARYFQLYGGFIDGRNGGSSPYMN
jgi:hypothetical protein